MPWYITGYLVMLMARRDGAVSLDELIRVAKEVGSRLGNVYEDADVEVRSDVSVLEKDRDVRVEGDRVVPTERLSHLAREVEEVATLSPVVAQLVDAIVKAVGAPR